MHRANPNNRAVETGCGYSLHLKIVLTPAMWQGCCNILLRILTCHKYWNRLFLKKKIKVMLQQEAV